MREVLEALGLIDLRPAPAPELTVSCPTCGAAVGQRCTGDHNRTLQVVHAGRRRVHEPTRRQQIQTVECPECLAEPGQKCLTVNNIRLTEPHKARKRLHEEQS